MAILTRQLRIVQGATFRETFACDITGTSITPSISAWQTGFSFDLSVGLRGDANYSVVASGTASASTNNVTIELDESVTALISDLTGRFVVEVTNGVDRWRLLEGAWRLDRDTA